MIKIGSALVHFDGTVAELIGYVTSENHFGIPGATIRINSGMIVIAEKTLMDHYTVVPEAHVIRVERSTGRWNTPYESFLGLKLKCGKVIYCPGLLREMEKKIRLSR